MNANLEYSNRIATTLAPEDPEIAFNLAAVLEACKLPTMTRAYHPHFMRCFATGGRLEDALTYYKRSKEFGVERAAMHIRNVGLLRVSQQVHGRLTDFPWWYRLAQNFWGRR